MPDARSRYTTDHLDQAHLHTIAVDGTSTRYYEAGEGEPLLLLHGGEFGSVYSLDCWSLNLGPLAGRFRVIALDRLGQGYTDNPAAPGEYTHTAVVHHVIRFVEELRCGPVHIAGHSRGGLVAASVALDHPDLVRSLVVVSSATLAEEPALSTGAFYDNIGRPGGRLPAGTPVTSEAARVEPDAQAIVPEQVTDDFAVRMAAVARLPKMAEAGTMMTGEAASSWNRALAAERLRVNEMISKNGLPVRTLVFWGADDRSAPVQLAFRIFERICRPPLDCELHVVSHAGHYCFRDQPNRFERQVTGFCLGT